MNFPKATLPDVIDERGNLVPGVTRVDIYVCEHFPDEFEFYAVQDVRVTFSGWSP